MHFLAGLPWELCVLGTSCQESHDTSVPGLVLIPRYSGSSLTEQLLFSLHSN